ncbi:MAG: histidine kinase [Bacteroidota bacterium]
MASQTTGYKKQRVIFVAFASWWGLWMVLHLVLLLDGGVPFGQAVADSVLSNLVLAAMCLLVMNNMRYYLPRKEKYLYVCIISIALSTLWLLIVRVSLWALYKTDLEYMGFISKTIYIRYAIAFLMTAVMTTLSLTWYTQKDLEEDDNRKSDLERLAREAELNKLRQQLQPHFLFNSLNSISALTGSQPEKARHMIQQLSDFLRGTLKKEEQQSTTLEEELQYLQLYLDIEKVRFGYRLQTRIIHDDDILQLQLPSMLLQPVVENAIKFGLYDTIGEVEIIISATHKDGILLISVQNPFDRETASPLKGTGFGLSSVRRRLFLLFGRNDLLETKQTDGQFSTTIKIPVKTLAIPGAAASSTAQPPADRDNFN